MTALSFVWVHPYSQNSRCDNMNKEVFFYVLNLKDVKNQNMQAASLP